MDKVYGIDLGTTYSCLAHVGEDGKAEVIKDRITGMPTVPSAVLKDGASTIVGRTAKNQSVRKADKYGELFKRHMGEVDADDPSIPYKYTLDGVVYSPQALSAAVLKKLVENANEELISRKVIEDKAVRAVITYPAYFNDSQRHATEQAGQIAGLDVVDVIEEPIAAAIYYVKTANIKVKKNILVYDLGGGTFDITLVRSKKGGVIEKLCLEGNARLGGADWDKKLIDYFVRMVSEENGVSAEQLRGDIQFMQDLSNKAEVLKCKLTETEEDSIEVVSRFIKDPTMSQEISITREKFDALTRPLLEETIDLIDNMYAKNKKLKLPKPDEILLVGGSTKMPQIRKRLEEKYPDTPIVSPDPDEAVAKGAAIYAKQFENSEEQPNIEEIVIQKASKSYGILVEVDGEEMVSNVVFAHQTLTTEPVEKIFGTIEENQSAVRLKLYESTSTDEYVELKNKKCGLSLVVEGDLPLSGNNPEDYPIKVIFDMSFGNMLKVIGLDEETGETIELCYTPKGSLTESEVVSEREKLDDSLQRK